MNKEKPYFAKYLPIEGEIKEEDKKFYCPHQKKIVGITAGISRRGAKVANRLYDPKPIQLFLCGKDINRNDSVYIDINDYINRSPLIVQEHAIETLKSKGAFKVIGEISLEASTWVKDCDEFNEDEIALGMGRNNYVLSEVTTEPKSDRAWYIPFKEWRHCDIRIKNAEGNFH